LQRRFEIGDVVAGRLVAEQIRQVIVPAIVVAASKPRAILAAVRFAWRRDPAEGGDIWFQRLPWSFPAFG
jgi:hypothetical protein